MPRGRRATELRCAAGYEGERLGDKGHVGQEDRASKPQGLRGDFILRKVGRHGILEHGTGGVIHFSDLLQDRVSHHGASCRSEDTREAERTVLGLQTEVALG